LHDGFREFRKINGLADVAVGVEPIAAQPILILDRWRLI
jgi:hypothetical protein